jgi:hypothetical protein
MLPTLDLFPTITRVEIEFLSPERVRLVAWCGDDRDMILTADPRDPEDLRELLQVPEVLLSAQAGVDLDETWARIRSRHDGTHEHGREERPPRRGDLS